MAIDSSKKRKSIAAISLLAVGPVVVPDSTIDQADRQVVGYSYSGIAAGEAATATYVCVDTVTLARASGAAALARATATVTLTGCS